MISDPDYSDGNLTWYTNVRLGKVKIFGLSW